MASQHTHHTTQLYPRRYSVLCTQLNCLSYQGSEALRVLRERVDLPAESPARLLRHPVEEGAGEPGEAEGGRQVEEAGGELAGQLPTDALACRPVLAGQALAQRHQLVLKLREIRLAIIPTCISALFQINLM